MKHYISIIILLVSFSFNVEAAETPTKKCGYTSDIEFFQQSLILVNEIKHELCSSEKIVYTFPEIAEVIEPAVSLLEKEYGRQFPDNVVWIEPWLKILRGIPNYDGKDRLKTFGVAPSPIATALQYGSDKLSPEFDHRECLKCSKAIKELGQLLQHLVDGFMERDLTETKNYYAVLSNSWDRYLEESRSQTWLDELTTRLFYSPDKEKLIGPPSTQYFFFHPSLLVENVSDALDGEQQKEAIGMELFGFNRWQAAMPYGASIGWVHSDRQSVKDLGTAIFFHLDNAYTLGYSEHDNDSGWFISVDLLKAFSDKKSDLKAWKKEFSNQP